MASNSLRSLYKSRQKEESTTSTRSKSRGLERKKNREDTVNKHRLLSDDITLSPLTEDENYDEERPKPRAHKKVNERMERLKQWREERKHKIEEEKKKKKPMFKVSNMKYEEEKELFTWDMKEKVDSKKPKTDSAVKKSAAPTTKPAAVGVKPAASVPTKAAVKPPKKKEPVKTRATVSQPNNERPAPAIREPRLAPTRATGIKAKAPVESSRLTRSATISNPAADMPASKAQPTTRQRGNHYSQLTASAAAKVQNNMDKPKEFLRAKSRYPTRSATQTQKSTAKNTKSDSTKEQKKVLQEEGLPSPKVAASEVFDINEPDDGMIVDEPAPQEQQPVQPFIEDVVSDSAQTDDDVATTETEKSGSSSDSSNKELHLSDSAVSTPKHSTPAGTRNSSTKRSVSVQKQEQSVEKSGRRRSNRSRKSRASTRRSARNLSVISAEDVALAFQEIHEPHLSSSNKEQIPAVLTGVEEEEEEPVNRRGRSSETLNKDVVMEERTPEEKQGLDQIHSGKRRSRMSSANRSLRRALGSARKSSQDTFMNEEEAEINPLEMSNKENVYDEEMNLRGNMLRKSVSKQRKSLEISRSTEPGRRSSGGEEIGGEPLSTPSLTRIRSESSSTSRRRSRRLVFSAENETAVNVDEEMASPAKRARRSTAATDPIPTDNMEQIQASENTKKDSLVIALDYPTPVSQQRTRMGSAIAKSKRRSVRIAGLNSTSGDDVASESEMELTSSARETGNSVDQMGTPAHKDAVKALPYSTRETESSVNEMGTSARKGAVRKCCTSTVVSVSDEGTSADLIGYRDKNVVDEVHISHTPRHDQHLLGSNKSRSKSSRVRRSMRRSARKSEVFDVSDEGTALALSPFKGVVYQVSKPVESESSSRALQELTVKKMGGEVSFIEVPMDESINTSERQGSSTSPLVKPLTSPATGNKSQTHQAQNEDNNHSTQAFTPRRSHEVTKLTETASSTQSSPMASASSSSVVSPSNATTPNLSELQLTTPKSNRRRGRSVAPTPSFKTPGQPLSALRPRSERRRKTEHSTPSKSPEEMIEILKKSPMIEMTRRRSRHISAAATLGKGPANFDTLFTDESPNKRRSNTTAPAIMETLPNHIEDIVMTDASASDIAAEASTSQLDKQQQLDPQVAERVRYFRELLISETKRLNQLCDKWNEISNYTFELGEDILGQIRSTVGKAQLLIDQRFKQFSGLVDNCEFGLGEKETTPTDLQGFWEMIYFQVEDVDSLFSKLTELQKNKWQVKQPSPVTVMPKQKQKKDAIKVSKPKVKSNFAAFRQELMKRKAQEAAAKTTAAVVAQENTETTKVFDAGFFKVTSPVRSPSGRQSGSNTPLKPSATETTEDINSDFTKVAPKLSSEGNSKPGTPVTHDKENAIMNTPHNSRLMSMSAKRLSYVPVVPSPLLNDITGIASKTKKL